MALYRGYTNDSGAKLVEFEGKVISLRERKVWVLFNHVEMQHGSVHVNCEGVFRSFQDARQAILERSIKGNDVIGQIVVTGGTWTIAESTLEGS